MQFEQWHKEAREIKLDSRSLYLRRLVVDALAGSRRGHLGPAFSLIEILRVLYDHVLNYRPNQPAWPERDRCILSKGHGCLGLYAILADKGFFPKEELCSFCTPNGRLGGHPEAGKVPGVEASTGALGHGMSIGVGMALAARLSARKNRVVVITGDGELNEGSVWESAMSAAKHHLDNFTVVVDYNKFQSYGRTCEVLDLEPLADKWRSFGFSVLEVNGHDVQALRDRWSRFPFVTGAPSVLICHTVKGKGLACAEDNPAWHHQARITDEQIQSFYRELGVEE